MSDRCDHDWSEEYICTVCGVVGTFAPPMWLWFHDGIKAGARTVLLALWTFADHNTKAPSPIFPSNKTIGKRLCGMAASTLREHLSYLKAEGWIRTVDGSPRALHLAWAAPFPVDERTIGDADGPGFLYVCMFSNGTVKVGCSESPARRIASHEQNAAVFGATLDQTWVSCLIHERRAAEELALSAIRRHAHQAAGSEWFNEIPFELAVSLAGAACEAATQ